MKTQIKTERRSTKLQKALHNRAYDGRLMFAIWSLGACLKFEFWLLGFPLNHVRDVGQRAFVLHGLHTKLPKKVYPFVVGNTLVFGVRLEVNYL